ncbi:dihydroorotate dehydrogenase [Feifania hominis]|uniref:Dihydroorotate dehydrogenase n=1 Tax=Feifania hominis TaxID=2763660 RepID=A0A926HU33_9FIRM|nr:dihydroorotate dehydrogenase [Feifania hominis]MBC8535116.1 dihydroorotate dehydrogenase [Feifania hominis]
MRNQKVNIAGVELQNPIVTASGTYGFGREYGEYYSLNELGAIAVKGLTLKKRLGNPPPRIAETPMGILNSVGLQNPGVEAFILEDLPFLKQFDAKVIANIAGNSIEDYVEMTRIVSASEVDLIEVNISCPNVKEGGVAFGTDCAMVDKVVSAVKKAAKKPVIVKLSPNVADIAAIARSAVQAGADALSLINTLLGMKIDIKTRRPILKNNVGGLSGPAVRPVAVRMIWQVANAVEVPIIGMGGVAAAEDAVEMMLAGASAVAVGTANFTDPYAALNVKRGLERYLDENGIDDVRELIGAVEPY